MISCENYYRCRLVVLANTPVQAKSLLPRLEQAAKTVGFNVNADEKKEFMCFNKDYPISY